MRPKVVGQVYFKTDVVELDVGRPHCKQCWSHTSLDE